MASSMGIAKVLIKTNKTKQKLPRPMFVTEIAPNKKNLFPKEQLKTIITNILKEQVFHLEYISISLFSTR